MSKRVYTDNELRDRWRAAGGEFHGPIIEHGSIKEKDLFIFLRHLTEIYPEEKSDD